MNLKRQSDTAISNTLGETLRERRLRRNMTQEQLADLVGVSIPTIQKLEKGKATLAVLIAALRALNSLELLTPLLTLPRVSPLAVASSTATARQRASSTATSTASRANDLVAPLSSPHTARLGENLLIPRKK